MQKIAFIGILSLFLTFLDLGQCFVLEEKDPAKKGRTKFDDDLREIVEFLKLQMQCGFPAQGVPPLAPFRSDFTEYGLERKYWSLKGNFTDLVITGLNDFDVVVLHWNNILRKITYELNFPSIEALSSYKLDAISRTFTTPVKFFGNGLFRLELINLNIKGSFKLKPLLISGGLAVEDFKSQVVLESTRSRSTGFMNSLIYTKLFNSWIEQFINLTFAEQKEVSQALEYLLVPKMDKALKNVSLVQLVKLIMALRELDLPTEAMC